MAAVLGIDVSAAEWSKSGELLEDAPRMRSLYNLHVLGEACALSASSGLPIDVAG